MKEVTTTNTVWSLGAVIYDGAQLTELWFGTRLDSGQTVSRKLDKVVPDILLAGLPRVEVGSDEGYVLTDAELEKYELVAEAPLD